MPGLPCVSDYDNDNDNDNDGDWVPAKFDVGVMVVRQVDCAALVRPTELLRLLPLHPLAVLSVVYCLWLLEIG